MNISSVDVAAMLEADSTLGLVLGDNLFIGLEPTSPENCVTIFDTHGSPPNLTLDQKSNYYPSIQIRVRNRRQADAWVVIQDIQNSLHGRAQETWNGTLYSVIYCSSGPALLDWDNNERIHLIINFNIQRR